VARLPVRVRQHEVVEHVRKWLATDRNSQLREAGTRRSQWGRREGSGGILATQLVTHHDGNLRASADSRETGSTAESGGDTAVGEPPLEAKNNGLTAPQNAPRGKQGISVNSFVSLASLSTQSLNHFADKLSKAEALSAEIARIHRGFGSRFLSRNRPKIIARQNEEEGKTRRNVAVFNTPVSI
jgi:hypothetical protein